MDSTEDKKMKGLGALEAKIAPFINGSSLQIV